MTDIESTMDSVYDDLGASLRGKPAPQRGAMLHVDDDPGEIALRIIMLGAALAEFFACVRMVDVRVIHHELHNALADALGSSADFQETATRLNRRAQRAESSLATSRRESDGQRKRAEWWREEAKRLGWGRV